MRFKRSRYGIGSRKFLHPGPIVTEEEALSLCKTGEWLTDLTLTDKISHRASAFGRTFGDWTKVGILLRDSQTITDTYSAFVRVLRERLEFKYIKPPPFSLFSVFSELRIRPNVVYKIGPTACKSVKNILGLILAIAASSPFPTLLLVWAGLEMDPIIRTILNGYEKLTDPLEKIAFEAVYKLHGKLSVVNYDALQNKDYSSAFGYIAPSISDIEAEVESRFTKEELGRALASMKSREVLGENAGRWYIRF